MKKLSLILLSLFISISAVSCGANSSKNKADSSSDIKSEPKIVSVASLKGPTSIGLIKLIDGEYDLDSANYTTNFEVAANPTLIVPRLLKGELDIAAVPLNVGATVFNATKGEYELAAINTLGVLYMVSSDSSIESLENLKGETIHCGFPGATPDYILRYLIKKSGLSEEDIKLDYSLNSQEVAQGLIGGTIKHAIVPEPFATMVTLKNKNLNRFLDIQEEWRKLNDGSDIIMGALLVKKSFNESNPEFVKSFLTHYKESATWANDNVKECGELLKKHNILPESKLAELAIPKCNVVYFDAIDKKDDVNAFLKVLLDFDKKSVGGKIPDDNFFMEK